MTARPTITTATTSAAAAGRRGLLEAPRCSGCGQAPNTPAEHLDLATEWLLAGEHGEPVARRFCRGCAPPGPADEIVCVRCGDGPLLTGPLATMDLQITAAVDAWLADEGWRLAGPVCPSCHDEVSR